MAGSSVLQLVIVCALLLPFGVAQAAKLYKVVDENGKVTFSQFPPSEKGAGEVESVKLKGVNDNMLSVTTIGNAEYCGDIELPVYYAGQKSHERYLQDIARRQKYWEDRLDDLEEQMERDINHQFTRNSSGNYYYRNRSYQAQQNINFQKNQQEKLNRVKELRCAVHWARSKQNDIEQFQTSNSQELRRLRSVYANLEAAMHRTCGEEPPIDPLDPVVTEKRSQWRDCTKSYRQDLKAVESELRSASYKIQKVN